MMVVANVSKNIGINFHYKNCSTDQTLHTYARAHTSFHQHIDPNFKQYLPQLLLKGQSAELKQLLTKKWSGWASDSLPASPSAPCRRSSLVCARPPAPCGPWHARPCSCSRRREARDRLAQIPAAAARARAATGRGTRRARCVPTSSVPFR